MAFINFNGKTIDQSSPIIKSDNRGLRYGDGLFETMKMVNGQIVHWEFHMERLFQGLAVLKFACPRLFTAEFIHQELLKIAFKNKVEQRGRIRLTIIRGSGGLFDPENLQPQYIIEATELPDQYFHLNKNGLVVDIYPDARKSCDILANIKHNNYLLYAMAALYAREHQWNDCLVLNQQHRICDTTIANLFWIKSGNIFTPPLTEGPVAGTMRRWLLGRLKETGYPVFESPVGPEDLLGAEEVFLTNAAYGLRWVARFGNKTYQPSLTRKIYQQFIQTNE